MPNCSLSCSHLFGRSCLLRDWQSQLRSRWSMLEMLGFVRGPSGALFALATIHVRLESGAEKAVVVQLRTPPEGPSEVHVFEAGEIASVEASALTSAAAPPAPDRAYEERLERLRKVLGE